LEKNAMAPPAQRLADVLRETFKELGAVDSVSAHFDEFAPIVAHRWRKLGHQISPNFNAQIRDKLQDYWPDSTAWKDRGSVG
jgi:hypothetical protein